MTTATSESEAALRLRGKRPSTRVALAVVAILAIVGGSLYAAYGLNSSGAPQFLSATSTITTPGYSCDSADLPTVAQQLETNSKFAQLSEGDCYNYVGEATLDSQGGNADQYTFAYYNGTVVYPCGTFPEELVVSQILANVPSGAGATSAAFAFSNDTAGLNVAVGCPPAGDSQPVAVVSAEVVDASVPAIPNFNLTLSSDFTQKPIASLTATIASPSSSLEVDFGISSSRPLLPGEQTFQLELLSGQTNLTTGGIYDMTIRGTFTDGQTFSYTVEIAVVKE